MELTNSIRRMAIKRSFIILLLSSLIISQEIVPRYWNSLSTHVTIGVPLVDDESLIGGRIQVRVNFDNGIHLLILAKLMLLKKEISMTSNRFLFQPRHLKVWLGFKKMLRPNSLRSCGTELGTVLLVPLAILY